MDTILVSRYEYKYLLPPSQVPEVRRFLLGYCDADTNAHGAGWYGIHSLYLDTSDYRFYRASADGAHQRLKLRVRSYADSDGPVKLEVKRRIGDVVTKRSLLVSKDMYHRFACEGVFALDGGSEFACLMERLRAAPKLLVAYERQAFHSTVDDYVRVTFDRRMRCQRARFWDLGGMPAAWRMLDDPPSAKETQSNYVLELKFKVTPPAWLHDMVTSFGLVRRGFSKYVRGIRHTIGDREPAWDLRPALLAPNRAWRVA